jgi:hypothetical protein
MDEENLSKCKVCGSIRVRKQDGFFPDGKNKRYVSESNLLWNGRTCPICVQIKAKLNIKAKRIKEKNAVPRDDSQD